MIVARMEQMLPLSGHDHVPGLVLAMIMLFPAPRPGHDHVPGLVLAMIMLFPGRHPGRDHAAGRHVVAGGHFLALIGPSRFW